MSDWFDQSTAREVDVAKVIDAKVHDYLLVLIQLGALVSLSKTSDGGALGITVTLDGRYRREYFRDPEEAEVWLEGACRAVENSVATASASRAPRNRTRGAANGR